MKRLVLLAMTAAMAAASTVPASADIHLGSQCKLGNSAASASVALTEATGGGLTYKGKIVAPGMTGTNGDHLTITSLTLSLPSPKVPGLLTDSAGTATTTTDTTLELAKDLPGAGAGIYTVAMTTAVKCSGGDPAGWSGQPKRSTIYSYIPGSAPVKITDTPGPLR